MKPNAMYDLRKKAVYYNCYYLSRCAWQYRYEIRSYNIITLCYCNTRVPHLPKHVICVYTQTH